jgi:hypothetical protein
MSNSFVDNISELITRITILEDDIIRPYQVYSLYLIENLSCLKHKTQRDIANMQICDEKIVYAITLRYILDKYKSNIFFYLTEDDLSLCKECCQLVNKFIADEISKDNENNLLLNEISELLNAVRVYNNPKFYDEKLCLKLGFHPRTFEKIRPKEAKVLKQIYGDEWKGYVWR